MFKTIQTHSHTLLFFSFNRVSDSVLTAVICNNVAAINKDQNIFDTKKKMKLATSEIASGRLSHLQRITILFNNCILLIQTNQTEACYKQLQEFKKLFPEAIIESLFLEAALLYKDKKVNEAIKVLESSTQKDNVSVKACLASTQSLLKQDRVGEAIKQLRSCTSKHKLAIVSLMVHLCLSLEDREGAIEILQDAINWYKEHKVSINLCFHLSLTKLKFGFDFFK